MTEKNQVKGKVGSLLIIIKPPLLAPTRKVAKIKFKEGRGTWGVMSLVLKNSENFLCNEHKNKLILSKND